MRFGLLQNLKTSSKIVLGKFAQFFYGCNMKIAIGLLNEKPEMEEEDSEDEYFITKQINDEMTYALMQTHHLGAKDPANPGNFWKEIVKFWGKPEEEVANRYCANCEYFDNNPAALEAMKSVPENAFDRNGGGRGFCHKYEFICHNLRVCDSWEEAEEEAE
jgi:hypothetical protein